jgi:hypothetical protein
MHHVKACSQLCHWFSSFASFVHPFVHVLNNFLIGFKLLIFVDIFDDGFVVRLFEAPIIFSRRRIFLIQQLGHAIYPADREIAAEVVLEGWWDRQIDPWAEVATCFKRDRAVVHDLKLTDE